jgi:hypothetical protein
MHQEKCKQESLVIPNRAKGPVRNLLSCKPTQARQRSAQPAVTPDTAISRNLPVPLSFLTGLSARFGMTRHPDETNFNLQKTMSFRIEPKAR